MLSDTSCEIQITKKLVKRCACLPLAYRGQLRKCIILQAGLIRWSSQCALRAWYRYQSLLWHDLR